MEQGSASEKPPISVVVATKVGAPFIDMCLDSFEQEAKDLGAEVILVASGTDAYAERLKSQYPWTKVVQEHDTSKVPGLRLRGVQEATSDLVAIIEEHCSAEADWLHQAIKSLSEGPGDVVGGAISPYNYSRLRDWVVYFCEYNGSMPPVHKGETDNLNDANIAYRKSLLLKHADLLGEGYWPMTMHPVALANGTKFMSEPDMVAYHRGPFDFGYYLGQRFLFSRAYAGVRAQSQSTGRRLAYLIGAPIIPALLLARMGLKVWQKQCHVKEFIFALPLTVPALCVFVAGEWVGCLLGPGDALSKVE